MTPVARNIVNLLALILTCNFAFGAGKKPVKPSAVFDSKSVDFIKISERPPEVTSKDRQKAKSAITFLVLNMIKTTLDKANQKKDPKAIQDLAKNWDPADRDAISQSFKTLSKYTKVIVQNNALVIFFPGGFTTLEAIDVFSGQFRINRKNVTILKDTPLSVLQKKLVTVKKQESPVFSVVANAISSPAWGATVREVAGPPKMPSDADIEKAIGMLVTGPFGAGVKGAVALEELFASGALTRVSVQQAIERAPQVIDGVEAAFQASMKESLSVAKAAEAEATKLLPRLKRFLIAEAKDIKALALGTFVGACAFTGKMGSTDGFRCAAVFGGVKKWIKCKAWPKINTGKMPEGCVEDLSQTPAEQPDTYIGSPTPDYAQKCEKVGGGFVREFIIAAVDPKGVDIDQNRIIEKSSSVLHVEYLPDHDNPNNMSIARITEIKRDKDKNEMSARIWLWAGPKSFEVFSFSQENLDLVKDLKDNETSPSNLPGTLPSSTLSLHQSTYAAPVTWIDRTSCTDFTTSTTITDDDRAKCERSMDFLKPLVGKMACKPSENKGPTTPSDEKGYEEPAPAKPAS